jgi:hypothetical protein
MPYGLFGQRTPALYYAGPKSPYSGSILDYLPKIPSAGASIPQSTLQAGGVPAPRDFTAGANDMGTINDLGSPDSPFMRLKGSMSGITDRLSKVLGVGNSLNEGAQAASVPADIVIDGKSGRNPYGVGGAYGDNGFHGATMHPNMGNHADAAQGIVSPLPTGAPYSGPAPTTDNAGPTSAGTVPLPPPRPADLTTPVLNQADPSKVIMYGTPDNPGVPQFDWRNVFGKTTGLGGLY